jgi:hypothetical protein
MRHFHREKNRSVQLPYVPVSDCRQPDANGAEDGPNAGLAGWGWADNSYGGFASPMSFQTSGLQTLRVQVREDGLSLDQMVLSAVTYATSAPGATKYDTTIVAK